MNKILNNEINHIKEYFDNANISRISVILTGSVARGEGPLGRWGIQL
jgi:predicted nucleotidyltransferase